MMHMKVAVLACCALTSCGYVLTANADEGKWTLGVSGGTLGLGPEVAYRYGKHLGARLNGGFYSHDDSQELDDIDYDGELKLSSSNIGRSCRCISCIGFEAGSIIEERAPRRALSSTSADKFRHEQNGGR